MLIKFSCNNPNCRNEISKFFKHHKDIPSFLDCGSCGTGKLEREFGAPTSKSVFVVDNGFQSKSVEVTSEILEREQKKVNHD
jgi:hypothetical protein